MQHPIIALAPNGAYKQKIDHSQTPLTLEEIVLTAINAVNAGATVLHLHVRDKNGKHSLDPDIYRRTVDAIENELSDKLVIQITSEAAGIFNPSTQINTIKKVNPDCVSIALRELITDQAPIKPAQALFHWCAEQACRIQFILYSEQDLFNYFDYLAQDIIPAAPHSVLFVLGRYSNNQQSSASDLIPFLKHQTKLKVAWMVCAFGASEQSCLIDSIHKGGHVRLGFENNLLKTDGSIATNNTTQLESIVSELNQQNIQPASYQQTKQLLQIR